MTAAACWGLNVSLLYAKHFKWILHTNTYTHFSGAHIRRESLCSCSQCHRITLTTDDKQDIISSPETRPTVATFITAGLIHTSNNQGPLATTLFQHVHVHARICCIFNTHMHSHTHLCAHNCTRCQQPLLSHQHISHIKGIVPLPLHGTQSRIIA